MKEKILLGLLGVVFSYLLLANLAFATLYVKPAKLGILRLEVFPLSQATTTKDFLVGNRYNFPLDITLQPTGNISSIIKLSENSFVLQPNETRSVEYTISVKDDGIYTGGIVISVKAENRTATIAYQADLAVIVTKNPISPLFYLTPILFVVGIATFLYFKKSARKRK